MNKAVYFKGTDLDKLYKELNDMVEKRNAFIVSTQLMQGQKVEQGKGGEAQEYILSALYRES